MALLWRIHIDTHCWFHFCIDSCFLGRCHLQNGLAVCNPIWIVLSAGCRESLCILHPIGGCGGDHARARIQFLARQFATRRSAPEGPHAFRIRMNNVESNCSHLSQIVDGYAEHVGVSDLWRMTTGMSALHNLATTKKRPRKRYEVWAALVFRTSTSV